MLVLHVEPTENAWIVRREGADVPLSSHQDAGGATREACARACTMSADASVLVHDRYHRVREEPPRLASSAGEAGRSRTGPGARG